MAEITLAGYTGYLFQELVKAREMADAYSRQVALRYGADPVLQHFSVPRFKIPKLELTVPVLVTGARFRRTVSFRLAQEAFIVGLQAIRRDMLRQIAVLGEELLDLDINGPSPSVAQQLEDLYRELIENPRPEDPTALVDLAWVRIVGTTLAERKITDLYRKLDPDRRIVLRSRAKAVAFVQEHTVVDKTELDSLLVNPETNVVKQAGDETSVFSLKVELIEDNFYLRSVTDPSTGQPHPIVEFE